MKLLKKIHLQIITQIYSRRKVKNKVLVVHYQIKVKRRI